MHSNIYLQWVPFKTLFVREVRRFLRVIFQTIATPLISTSLYLLIFGVSIGQAIDAISGVSYLAFLLPGLVMMTALRNAFENAMGSVTTAKFCGELEDLKIAPLAPSQIAWATGLSSVLRGMIVSSITLGIGFFFYWITEEKILIIEHPFVLLLFLFFGALAFGHLGQAITMMATHFEQVNAINTFVLLPLIYLGGVFFSLEQLHPIWKMISKFNPLLYMVNGVRYGMLGVADVNVYFSFAVTIFSWALCYFLAIFSLRRGTYQRW